MMHLLHLLCIHIKSVQKLFDLQGAVLGVLVLVLLGKANAAVFLIEFAIIGEKHPCHFHLQKIS
jgi:hypothetical protein